MELLEAWGDLGRLGEKGEHKIDLGLLGKTWVHLGDLGSLGET